MLLRISHGEYFLSGLAKGTVVGLLHGGAARVDSAPDRAKATRSAFHKILRDLDDKNAIRAELPQKFLEEYPALGMAEAYCLAAIRKLEAEPLLNAGLGAALQRDGIARVSASFMESARERFSSVMNLQRVVYPSELAYFLQFQEYSVLDSLGAENLAVSLGVARADLVTELRYQDWQAAKIGKSGTVGCVVVDSDGKLAAATSTGGMGNEIVGRIGDTPTVAGNYCTSRVAVSCTGIGEQITSLAFSPRLAVRVGDGMALGQAMELGLTEAAEKDYKFGAIAIAIDAEKKKVTWVAGTTTEKFLWSAKSPGTWEHSNP